MAYIGKEPQVGNYVKLDAISTSSTNTYNLTKDSVAFTPESALHMLVSLNGVIQSPLSSFSVSGSTITFLPSSGTLSSSDTIDFILVLGNVLDICTPSDSTVTNAKTNFASSSSSAGLQIKGDGTSSGTSGTLQLNCSQNSHGVKIASPAHSAGQSYTLTLPTGNVTAGKMLKVDSVTGSGATGVGQLSFTDPIMEADMFRLTANIGDSNPISSNLERVDDASFSKIGTGMSVSSGIFSFPRTGLYLVGVNAIGQAVNDDNIEIDCMVTQNNSDYDYVFATVGSGDNGVGTTSMSAETYVNVTDTSNVKVKFIATSINSGSAIQGSTLYNVTAFHFIRLGESQ